MIEPLLPRYYEANGDNPRYEILESFVINGHEVAWTEYSGTMIADLSGQGREGESYSERAIVCECDFTEGVGWKVEDGRKYSLDGGKRCVFRHAVMYMRHQELRMIYQEQFADDDPFGDDFVLVQNAQAIILDLIERVKNGEFLEDSNGAAFWGGYFYLQTAAKIIGCGMGYLWEDAHALIEQKHIGLEGAVVTPYREPPPPIWEEFARISDDDGWVGIAYLPGHREMAREWKFEVKRPDGEDAYLLLPGQKLLHDPIFGPDVEDIARAEERLAMLIEQAKDLKSTDE